MHQLLATIIAAIFLCALSPVRGMISPNVVISQVYGGGGNSGSTLTNDFIELFNRGATTVDLSGWSLQYASATGTTWQVTPLSGSIAPGHYYLVQQGTGGGTLATTPDAVGTISLGGTQGKVALVRGTTQLTGNGCPFKDYIVDFVGYGNTNCSEGSIPAQTLSGSTAAFRSRGGCHDTDNNLLDFYLSSPNPRGRSSPQRDCSAKPSSLAINKIQGNGAASPYVGKEISTAGIVTALKSNGFFLQTADADVDSDPNTSEGIFVFTSIVPFAAVRESVSVVGTVSELNGLTQLISSNLDITTISISNPLPAPIALTKSLMNPGGALNQFERFEGMRMSLSSLVSISPTNDFGEIFTVPSTTALPLREPGIEISRSLPPGSPCCVPRFDGNPERFVIDTDGQAGSTALVLTSGVTLRDVGGPLDYGFGNYKILPDKPPVVTPNLSAIPLPVPAGNEFSIASLNLENFYLTNPNIAGRMNKASLAIRNIMRSPDIIGIEEVGDLTTLTALANKINKDSGSLDGGYQAILLEGDDDGEQDIDVGFLVRTARVKVMSVKQEGRNTTYLSPLTGRPEILNDRPPLILRARVQSPAGSTFPVTVIVNHLRSLIGIDENQGDGPRVREKRRKQAEFLANLVQSLQDENLVLVGDFNSFQFSDGYVDVIGTILGTPAPSDQVVLATGDLVNPDLTALVERLPPEERYSYNFAGNRQTLDHVLVDGEMLARLSRFVYARNNSDFPQSFGSDWSRPERVSDHDMPVAYFTFPK